VVNICAVLWQAGSVDPALGGVAAGLGFAGERPNRALERFKK
jgi:hypothetical protein